MSKRTKGRASLAALREAFSQSRAAQRRSLRPALLGVGRVTNIEEEASFEGRTMGVTFEEFAAVAVEDGQDVAPAVRTAAVFETTRGANTDVVWFVPWQTEPISLGRNRENDIVVPEYSISGEHCRFRWKGHSALLIEDREASNKVWVDGMRLPVDTPRQLAGGEQLVLGRFMFCFLYADLLRRLLLGGELVVGDDGRFQVTEPQTGREELRRAGGGFLKRLFGRK